MIRRSALALLFASISVSASFGARAADAAAPAQVDPAKGQSIASTVCVGCHGADGNSAISANPILAGQGKEYLFKQLSNFKSVDGKPAVRVNGVMGGMVAALSEDDMKSLAVWFSSQKTKPSVAKDDKLVTAGQKLWRAGDLTRGIPACAGCHGATGAGLPAQYPRLAGQYADYTEAQLKLFRTGERANDPEGMMRMIAAKLSDKDIKSVSEYAAGLR